MEEYSMERVKVLWKLHNLDYWSEDLLSKTLFPEVEQMFTKREREILGSLIEHKTMEWIRQTYSISNKTLKNYKSIFRHIFRTGERPNSNLDNHLRQKIRRFKYNG